ncbi:DUF309 domain-containing protein [Actinoplanes utahensis]|nr:DUF309 domain-containing protein [Actinoplanes utahensis]
MYETSGPTSSGQPSDMPAGEAGGVVRDRDAGGRAKNARPRDGLGRPLPRGMTGIPTTPEDLVLPPAEALREAGRLLGEGRPFHAHEVLEGTWKAAGDDERELWRGLAQLAVGITHARRGNATGAISLLTRAADRIEPFGPDAPHDVAVPGLVAWARGTIARLEAGTPIAAAEFAPALVVQTRP